MGLWQDKIRKDWRYSFEYRKKTYAGAGFKRRKDAESARADRRKKVKEEVIATPTGTDFLTVANEYLEYCERRFVKKTFDFKKLVYKRFLKHSKNLAIHEIKPDTIHKYLNTLPSNNAYNTNRKELSSLFNYAIRKMKIHIDNPCNELDKMPHTTQSKLIPSEQDILKMIVAADPETDERDLILCCIHTLGRIDELLRLTWQDVNFEARTVTLRTRKRRGGAMEADELPMNDDLYAVLKSRWDHKKQSEWVFYNEKTESRYNRRPKFMAGICKRAGIEPIGTGTRLKKIKGEKKRVEVPLYYGFHSLRHFMASYLKDKHKTHTKALQGLLRHRNLSTTEIYVHSIDESQKLAMKKIEGIFTKPQSEAAITKKQEATETP